VGIKAGLAMSAKNTQTGRNQSARNRNASQLEHALTTYLALTRDKPARRKSPEEIHAQLILIIGATLAAVFLVVTVGITYALIFVTQPIGAQAPNDAAFIDSIENTGNLSYRFARRCAGW
jgi:hypothetical protein